MSDLKDTALTGDRYQIDLDKVETVKDTMTLIRAVFFAYNDGTETDLYISKGSPYFDKLKHLMKEGKSI